ncbi:head fiber protein [Brevibacillus brevis]|uniref:head fiber protein n=1 Tax=Brevibacillus brevis TaxID=1393 RepID=UPI0021AD99C0|nr:head fiber protein [Brevibacillus brevis]
MSYQTKNYVTDNGNRHVIGGILELVGEGKILKDGVPIELGNGGTAIADGSISTAKLANGAVTLAKLGTDAIQSLNKKLTATKAAAQADSIATDVAGLVADFNALLAKLRAAGIMT